MEEVKSSQSQLDLYNLFHEYLEYDSEDGELRWKKVASNRVKVGECAGSLNPDGYIQLQFFGKLYKAHRIVWFMSYGSWPKAFIDHIDGNRSNNRLDNLRDVDQKINGANDTMHHDNLLGHKGVSYDANYAAKPYRVQISRLGKIVHCSYYADYEEACAVAKRVYSELGSRL